MEFIYLVIFGFVVRAMVAAIRDRGPQMTSIAPQNESLCLYCTYAHIARGYQSSEEMTYCTYAGTAREVKFAVSDCSMFCPRNAGSQAVRVIGFAAIVNESVSPQVAAKVCSE